MGCELNFAHQAISHVSNPVCVSTLMWVGRKRFLLGHLVMFLPQLSLRSLPLSSHCREGWGARSLYFRAQAGSQQSLLLPTAWNEDHEDFWQGWVTELNSQLCPRAVPARVQPRPAWWDAESSTGLQLLVWAPGFTSGEASQQQVWGSAAEHSYHDDRQCHAFTDLETWTAAAKHNSLWGVIS